MAERVGFEPTVPFGITGFQDQLLKPLGHLSMSEPAKSIISGFAMYVNPFFAFFENFSNSPISILLYIHLPKDKRIDA